MDNDKTVSRGGQAVFHAATGWYGMTTKAASGGVTGVIFEGMAYAVRVSVEDLDPAPSRLEELAWAWQEGHESGSRSQRDWESARSGRITWETYSEREKKRPNPYE